MINFFYSISIIEFLIFVSLFSLYVYSIIIASFLIRSHILLNLAILTNILSKICSLLFPHAIFTLIHAILMLHSMSGRSSSNHVNARYFMLILLSNHAFITSFNEPYHTTFCISMILISFQCISIIIKVISSAIYLFNLELLHNLGYEGLYLDYITGSHKVSCLLFMNLSKMIPDLME